MTSFNLSNFINRAKELCTDPKGTWGKIKNESIGNKELYMSWIIPGTAIRPVATFIGLIVFGVTNPFTGITYRPAFMGALMGMMVSFLLGLASIYILALVFSKLAPKFEGKEDLNAALKLTTFSCLPAWFAGVLMLLPNSAMLFLAWLVSVYGLYLLFVGIPEIVGVPAAKRIPYFALSILTILVVVVVFSFFVATSTPTFPIYPAG